MFYTSGESKIPVKMMRSRGFYSVGEIPKMDCEAIEFPYDVRPYCPSRLLFSEKSLNERVYSTERTLLHAGDHAEISKWFTSVNC